ncbi:AbgT family transporter [Marinimicrobium sp. ARAG 43.8]|uniref:AbgT family transporter n=1 Tax=Marinimicrobium sp. ARAG 43.8 TaxID=3418719 RepID=UPI003CECD0A5
MKTEHRAMESGKGFLGWVARSGNRLPVPALLFLWLCLFLMGLSALVAAFGVSVVLPGQAEPVSVRSLLSAEGIRWILTHTVDNFVTFAPVGTVLVAMLGLGVAEHSGLLKVLLQGLVRRTPRWLLTWVVVLAGILSNLAMDAGYVVLIPLAALMFAVAGRPPLAGIAAAFAGVSAGYSANLFLGPVDVILSGMSTEAVAIVNPDYRVPVAGNYYFIVASTLLLSVLGAVVTERWVLPHLRAESKEPENAQHENGESEARVPPVLTQQERHALWAVGAWTLVFLVVVLGTTLPEGAPLRDPAREGLGGMVAIQGVVVLIALYAAVAGWLFGRLSGQFRDGAAVITAMETTMSTMAGYLVLMFFAAQFVNFFAWSHLGTALAVAGANWLGELALPGGFLLVIFVALAAFINLFIGSASAKWGLLAPVFVPMLYLLGLSPEATQMAFRIGDSTTNIISPLMPYFGVVVAFAQRYKSDLGIGTLMAMMLPYSIAFLLGWSGLLLVWFWLGWPLGPDAPILLL